jgi:hypothetical protein
MSKDALLLGALAVCALEISHEDPRAAGGPARSLAILLRSFERRDASHRRPWRRAVSPISAYLLAYSALALLALVLLGGTTQ